MVPTCRRTFTHARRTYPPANRVQQLLFERPIDLFPQAADQHVDDVGLGVEAVLPHVRQDHRLRHDLAGVPHQVLEERELPRPQIEHRAGPRDAPREQIEHEIVDGQRRRFRGAAGAAHQRLHARQQLRERERLGEVIVAAGLQAAHAVVHRSPRAQDQHRRQDAAAPHLLDEREAVAAREHHVDDGDVVGLSGGGRQPRVPVDGVVDDESRLAQPADDEFRNRRIVFDQQGPHDASPCPLFSKDEEVFERRYRVLRDEPQVRGCRRVDDRLRRNALFGVGSGSPAAGGEIDDADESPAVQCRAKVGEQRDGASMSRKALAMIAASSEPRGSRGSTGVPRTGLMLGRFSVCIRCAIAWIIVDWISSA